MPAKIPLKKISRVCRFFNVKIIRDKMIVSLMILTLIVLTIWWQHRHVVVRYRSRKTVTTSKIFNGKTI